MFAVPSSGFLDGCDDDYVVPMDGSCAWWVSYWISFESFSDMCGLFGDKILNDKRAFGGCLGTRRR